MDIFFRESAQFLVFFFLLLILPGLLTSLTFNSKRKSFLFHLVAGFCLSLLLNHIAAFIVVIFNLELAYATYLLIAYCCILFIKFSAIKINLQNSDYSEIKYVVLPCLLLVIVMSMNGGLLVLHSDAWWHISYAKKISASNQIFLDYHHLSGLEIKDIGKYLSYLPGWHLILALLHQSSGLAYTTIWHNLAGFLTPITFVSYFLFSKALSRNNIIALLSALLLSLIFGGLNSYFRISPWPGNVSYIIWYFLYFLAFTLLWEFPRQLKPGFVSFLKWGFNDKPYSMWLALVCCYLILTIHASELLWFAVSFIFYYLLATYISKQNESLTLDIGILTLPVVLLTLAATILFFYQKAELINPDLVIAGLQFISLLIIGLIFHSAIKSGKTQVTIGLVCLVAFIAFNIDFSQLKALFYPVKQQLSIYGHHHPYPVEGIFGHQLILPQWEHQLREGILFAALTSIIVACYLSITDCNRTHIFLLANSCLSFLVLISPYLFTFLNNFTPYTSTYRVHLLIFHPIIFACIFYKLYFLATKQPVNQRQSPQSSL